MPDIRPPDPSERILTSLAILKANWDAGQGSYLDNFLPFVADCLNACTSAGVTAAELSERMLERFGIPLPTGVVQTLLRKAAREGLGVREHGRFKIDRAAVAGHDLTRLRSDAQRRQEALVDRLVRFASEEHDLALDRDAAETALLTHLERHATSILKAALRGVGYQPALPNETLDYLVSDFVAQLFARDPDGFDYMESLVKGSMLATAVYLPAPAEAGRRFDQLTAYFDTRLLLQGLGYEGPEAEAAARQTLTTAYELGAKLAALSDTVSETRGVLIGIANNFRRSQRPSQRRLTEEWFRKQGYTASDIELIAENLEADLRGLRISVVDRPPPQVSLTVDEQQLEQMLQEKVGYQSRAALLHDLDALTAVFRLRRGGRPSQLERARAAFVTTNTPLVAVARQFFDGGDSVALALTDDDFATLVWLKRPLSAPELPRMRIIADCYAALEPGNELWNKYLDEVDKLRERESISEGDYFVLRYSLDAKQALMNRTLGSVDRLSEGVVDEVLDRARESIKEPEVRRAREAEALSTTAEGRAAEAIARADAAEQRAAAAEDRAQASARVIDDQRRRARNTGEKRGRLAQGASFVTLAVLFATAAYFSLPSTLELPPTEVSSAVRWVLRVVVGGGVLLALVCQMTGHTPASIARRIEVTVSKRTERRMLQKFGLVEFVSDDAGHGTATAGSHRSPQ